MNKFPRLYDPLSPAGGGSALTAPPAPVAPPAPAPSASVTASSTEKHWTSTFEGLSDDLRSNPAFQPFKSPVDALKAYADVQPLLGRDKAPIPTDWNDAKQVAAFNSKIGVPEKAEGYDLGKVLTPKLPAGTKLDDKQLTNFQAWAHEAGLTPRQAASLSEKYIQGQLAESATATKSVEVERANALNQFKQERGSAFDTDVALARKALVNYGDDKMRDLLDSTGLGDHPLIIQMFAKVGASLREDTAHPSGAPGHLQANSPDAARVRLAELKGNKSFMDSLMNVNDPNHKNATAEWIKLNGMLPSR